MARGPLAATKVQEKLGQAITVAVDCDQSKKLAQDYRVGELPAFVILTRSGIVIAKRAGFIKEDELLEFLSTGYEQDKSIEANYLKLKSQSDLDKTKRKALAVWLEKRGNYLEARGLFEAIADDTTAGKDSRLAASYSAAQIALITQRFSIALKRIESGIKIDSQSPAASKLLYLKGYLYEVQKKKKKAIESYRAAASHTPGNSISKLAKRRLKALGT